MGKKGGIFTTRTIVYLPTQARLKRPSIQLRWHGCEAKELAPLTGLPLLRSQILCPDRARVLKGYYGTIKMQLKPLKNLSSYSESEILSISFENVKEMMTLKLERNGGE